MTDFAYTKSLFHLPEGMVYLDGNSLGPLPKAAMARLARTTEAEWGEMLIGGWNKASWMDMPSRLGDRIGKLIGAPDGTVVLGDTLSVKIYQALASALELRPDRKVLLSDTGNFPSDLYMAEGLIRTLAQGHVLKTVRPDHLESEVNTSVAALLLTEVDYRTGRKHDMARLIARAHEAGALIIWDLAHSAGALPVDVTSTGADFAAGCTYKYLNGGPGAPAFMYVRPDHISHINPALSGWLGHAAPFAFDLNYKPGTGIERMRVGTPPILQMAALDAALDVWEHVNLNDLRRRSIELSELFIAECERCCPELKLASPRDPDQRGSQVSFLFQHGYSAMQALIDHGVIGDFRAPEIMRFGITPLYIDENDLLEAAGTIGKVMNEKLWEQPEYQTRQGVT
jgi:kynureninase